MGIIRAFNEWEKLQSYFVVSYGQQWSVKVRAVC